MSRLFESDYLYGLHDPGGEHHMLDAGRPGWIVFTEGIGHDPNDRSGADYRPYSDRGLGIITRLNNGYYPAGTIPNSAHYADFARRCANFVAASPGCKIWIIGNETNYRIERPLASATGSAARSVATATSVAETPATPIAPSTNLWGRLMRSLRRLFGRVEPDPVATDAPDPDATTPAAIESFDDDSAAIEPPADDPYLRARAERFNVINEVEAATRSLRDEAEARAVIDGQEVITPELYARCFRFCRDAIRSVAGHEDDLVIVASVAPWNNQTKYAGNPQGDWVQYFAEVLALLGPSGCDGITLHTYTHQADANLITSDAKMNPPFENRHFEFRAYRDFMEAIPANMRHLPVYITETDQDVPWLDQNIEWIQRAYGEINWWNQQAGNQQIRSLILYRYPPIDRWVIQGKDAVIEDFRMAMQHGYRWQTDTTDVIKIGATVATTDIVNLRRTAGFRNKPNNDVVLQMPNATESTVVNGPETVDGLVWWQVRINGGAQAGTTGWTAEAVGEQTLLRLLKAPDDDFGEPVGDFKEGDTVQTTTVVRMRRSPGYLNKPLTDIIADIPAESQLTVLDGPRNANGLVWWQVRSVTTPSREGWMAQKRANGAALLELVKDDDEPIEPPPSGTFEIGDRIQTTTVVRMRRTPGYTQKPANDVLADIAQATVGTVEDGPELANTLTWWQVRTTTPNGNPVTGWMAEVAPNGITLLEKAEEEIEEPPVESGLAIGDIVAATTVIRLRKSPGYLSKPADDVLGDFGAKATVNVIAGPEQADETSWWRVGGVVATGEPLIGWSAEQVGETVLLAQPEPLVGTTIPNKATDSYLPMPFRGDFGIAQLWGENPQIYSQITYDGVPLRGHNGIDFLTPTGTPIVAIDNGVIEEAVYNDPSGFGHFIKVRHSWGEALYAHLSRLDVQTGAQVVAGNLLGATGNTGFTFGPHLHFALRINPYNRTDGWGGFSDPLPYLRPAGIQLPNYVVDAPSTRSVAQVQMAPDALRSALSRASGYAPDQPNVKRP